LRLHLFHKEKRINESKMSLLNSRVQRNPNTRMKKVKKSKRRKTKRAKNKKFK
jgi:hypothetical protein